MKKFLKYVVPSVLAFALSGIYAIVDGFFVGNSVGVSVEAIKQFGEMRVEAENGAKL